LSSYPFDGAALHDALLPADDLRLFPQAGSQNLVN